MSSLPQFNCPICANVLSKQQRTLKCQNNHCFDYAKEGYVNLLPVQLKKSLQPGDDLAMVQARRAFLEAGNYDFLRQKVVAIVKELPCHVLVDLGCGEGYYTNELKQQLSQLDVYGVDISKSAVKYAAKRHKDVHYAVATNAHLPFANHQVDVIVNIFAPLVGKECHRILAEDGAIISVAPGPDHLIELKREIYDNAEQHDAPTPPEGFDIAEQWKIKSTISIADRQQLTNLLTMTPFGWKTSQQSLEKLTDMLPFSVTLDFVISQFKSKS